MPLEPQTKSLLDAMKAAGGKSAAELTVEENRQAIMNRRELAGPPESVAKVENRTIPGPEGQIPIRIYTPEGPGPFPILVFFHGGGWVIGNLETADAPVRALTNRARCVAVSVDYRLAPEHKFPAAPDDCYAATVWAAENARSIGGDPSRIAVGGDSSGGNLAAVVALMARDRGLPRLAFQLLVYPVTNRDFNTASYRENAEGYNLTRDAMIWFWNHYLASDADASNPYASPLLAASLTGLPPAFVITAEYDPLRDEGESYAQRLREADVPTQHKRYAGTVHGFFGYGGVLDLGKQVLDDSAAALRAAFGT